MTKLRELRETLEWAGSPVGPPCPHPDIRDDVLDYIKWGRRHLRAPCTYSNAARDMMRRSDMDLEQLWARFVMERET